jgi:hypothetical protein
MAVCLCIRFISENNPRISIQFGIGVCTKYVGNNSNSSWSDTPVTLTLTRSV